MATSDQKEVVPEIGEEKMVEDSHQTKTFQVLSVKNEALTFVLDSKSFALDNGANKTKISVSLQDVLKMDEDEGLFTCHFIDKSKSPTWKAAHVTFKVKDDNSALVEALKDAAQQSKKRMPGKTLVYCNPYSGRKNGRKALQKVLDVFKRFELDVDVTISGEPKRIEEVLSDYDLRGLETVVCVGGDGTYCELLNALLRRVNRDAGHAGDDVQQPLPKLNIKIGLVGAGTQNGIALVTYKGACDPETSVLHILQGSTCPYDVWAVSSGGKLLSYSAVCLGFGFFGVMSKTAESNRQLGQLRYLWAAVKHTVKRVAYNMEMEYLPPLSSQLPAAPPREGEEKDEAEATEKGAEGGAEWQTMTGQYRSLLLCNFEQLDWTFKSHNDFASGYTSVLLEGLEGTRMQRVKTMVQTFKMSKGDDEAKAELGRQSVRLRGLRVKVLEGEASGQYPLNVDGDCRMLPAQDFTLIVHQGVAQVYC